MSEVEKIEIDPEIEKKGLYKIMSGCVVPRPIGFISTLATDGVLNAAPFSFFNAISDIPPMLCVSICTNAPAGTRKDTFNNIVDTGEFVANIVSEEIVPAQDSCAKPVPPDVDEIRMTGLTPVASKLVRPPRIAESPVNFECRLHEIIPLPGSTYTLLLAKVVYIHLRKDLLTGDQRIDPVKLRAVARMAGFTYARTTDLFAIEHNIPDIAARGAGVS